MAPTSPRPNAPAPPAASARVWTLAAATALVLAGLLAYWSSLSAPFLFDDRPAIVDNPTIQSLGSPGAVLGAATPTGSGIRGRPLVNLTLALNYAAGGLEVRGYHAVNLAIHVLAALVLFSLVRRTLRSPLLRARFGGPADPAALAVALLWAVHPLLSETVICTVQRTESLMGLCLLLMLDCFARAASRQDSGRTGRLWFAAAVAACAAGMASKETMVGAPLLVFLYDAMFVAGSARQAWQRRKRIHLALAATWLLLAALVVASGGRRGGTVGFDLGVSPWDYLLTQCRAIVQYLCLAIWPHPLVGDYGTALVHRLADVWPQALLLTALAAATVLALRRRSAAGFAGAWFFVILAPSSSVLPLASQTAAEHRMYLPLAAPVALAALGLFQLAGRRALVLTAILAAALGWLTVRRGDVYRSEHAFWTNVAARQPDNARARYNLGCLLERTGRYAEAEALLDEALRLHPGYAEAHNNLGNVLAHSNRLAEAIAHYQQALEIRPSYPEACCNLGDALLQADRADDAAGWFREALRLKPDYPAAHANLGVALVRLGRTDGAIAEFEQALRLQPDDVDSLVNIANAFSESGRQADAIRCFETALRLKPRLAEAHNGLGLALAQDGHLDDAMREFGEALRERPDYPAALSNLGVALLRSGRYSDSLAPLAALVRLEPDDPMAHFTLAGALARAGHPAEAAGHYEAALRLKPDFSAARECLAALKPD